MISGPQNPKLQGVRRTTTTGTEGGAPRVVLAVEPAEYLAVAFNDEQGRLQRMVVLRVGDAVYVPPGSIEWSASLRPAASWLAEEVLRKAGKRVDRPDLAPGDLPADDPVDVLGGGDESEGQDDANPTAG